LTGSVHNSAVYVHVNGQYFKHMHSAHNTLNTNVSGQMYTNNRTTSLVDFWSQ